MSEQNKTKHSVLKSRLGRRIFVLFLGCAVLPLVSLAIFSLSQVTDKILEEAHHRLHSSAKSAGMTVMERLLFLEADLAALTTELENNPDYDPSILPAITQRIRGRLNERFSGMALVSLTNQQILASALGQLDVDTYLGQEDHKHLQMGRTLVKVQSDAAGPAVLMARLTGPASNPCMLIGCLKPEYLWSGEGFLPPSTELLILDEARRPLYSSSEAQPFSELQRALTIAQRSGKLEWEHADEAYIGGYWTLFARYQFNTSFVVAQSQKKEVALVSYYEFRRFFLLLIGFAFSVVLLMSMILIRRNLDPITQLRSATEQLAAEDFDVHLQINSDDEFQDLGNAFNDMAAKLLANINARKQVELELIKACDDAREAARTETDFVRNVSHELRTPMASIRSFAEILRDYDEEDPGTREEFLGIIITESERLTRLIDDILDFSKVQADGSNWKFKIIDVTEVFRDAAQALNAIAENSKITLENNIPYELMATAANRDRLTQVCTNLIANALKFTGEGGKVALRASQQDDCIILEIEDSGCGIAKEEQDAIFERFRQVSSCLTKDKPTGTGLSLPIANEIVQRHHGRIDVESELGKGSLFRVTLPVLSVAEVQKAPAAKAAIESSEHCALS